MIDLLFTMFFINSILSPSSAQHVRKDPAKKPAKPVYTPKNAYRRKKY